MSCGSEERRVRLTKRSVSARGGFSQGRWLSQTTVQCGSAVSRSQVSSRNPRHSLCAPRLLGIMTTSRGRVSR